MSVRPDAVPRDAAALLRTLAVSSRFNGSAGLAAAQERCADALVALGFSISREPFEFSKMPARWGMPTVAGASVVLLATVAVCQWRGNGLAAMLATVASLTLLALLTRWWGSAAAQRLRGARGHGVNIQAVRDTHPHVWLVAHLDSKSQRYPLALRALGALLLVVAWAASIVLTLTLATTGLAPGGIAVVLGAGLLGALLLGLGAVGEESPGAVDNASGVAAVLGAAALLPPGARAGILITDAEELGLAGAHAWALGRPPGIAVNVDTLDDAGAFALRLHGPRCGELREAAMRAANKTGIACGAAPLPPGILTDGVALSRAGWACATLTRATPGTLWRIHTARDSVRHLEGTAIGPAAALLAALVEELC